MEWVVDQQRSSRGVGGNQVYLDEKLAARGNSPEGWRGCGQRRLKILQYQSPYTCVGLKNKTDGKIVNKRVG